ncbi:MAG: 2-haloalkanoic acid dehalogenase [Micavibrio aeruginosavorus]|uniref:2-haloalkanoic acid dehalogenase n=1 Tax=Micavibrio aeruginosavorus TaxID=349221 RepID=A0A2W5FH56_9BACT|nr:MAG: 2-haloalkanoic acid dehalogenase [Micavibrio aeruginosavorus]
MKQNQDSSTPTIKAVVFDIGNVLIDWDPKNLYRQLIDSEEEIDAFLTDICHYTWNLEQDRGRLWADAVAEKIAEFPDHADLIRAYDERWADMVSGPIQGSVDILMQLKESGIPLYAITNFSREKWDIATEVFPFLNVFLGVTVSADVKLLKPDPVIYQHFLKTFNLDPSTLLFIDDRPENVQAAIDCGFQSVQFFTPEKLAEDLKDYGL